MTMNQDKSTQTSFKGVVPKCSSREDFYNWKAEARKVPPSKTVGFCEDCTPEFKAKHITTFTCENPLIVFEKNQSAYIDGCLPKDLSEEVKQCVKCGETKLHSAFRKRTAARDGLQTKCRACMDYAYIRKVL